LVTVVGVRFKKAGKVYYFDPAEQEIKVNDPVIVETARGLEQGTVVLGPRDVPEQQIVAPLKKVIRKATDKDLEQVRQNRAKEAEALDTCAKKIATHGLDMHLVDAEYTFDNSKIIFYFTAEGRVDFRELVKDLASVFRTRIELRQIGVRDEAKITGGIGPCGRIFCCKSFLGDFQPVSIKMAKEQNLSLNPTKISGVCGRLMCCLRYECEHYEDTRLAMPEVGSRVVTVEGEGRVAASNVLRNTVSVELDGGKTMEFPVEEVEVKKCARAASEAKPAGAGEIQQEQVKSEQPRPQQEPVAPRPEQTETPAERAEPQAERVEPRPAQVEPQANEPKAEVAKRPGAEEIPEQ
jgi:cell fate regulator YaaT (PSP1 superfamily)